MGAVPYRIGLLDVCGQSVMPVPTCIYRALLKRNTPSTASGPPPSRREAREKQAPPLRIGRGKYIRTVRDVGPYKG